MLQKFQTLTKSFLYTLSIVVLVSLTVSFSVVIQVFHGSHFYVQTIITGVLGLVVFPLIAFIIFAWIYLIYYYIFDVLFAHHKSIKLFRSTSNNVPSDTLAQSLEQRFSAQPTQVQVPSIALSQSDKQAIAFNLSADFQSKHIQFIGMKNAYLIRIKIDQPTLPTLIISSRLNNDTAGSIDTSLMTVKTVDLGSDFGKYFSLSFIEGNEVDALQIVDPVLMLALLEDYTAYDIVISQSYIDLKFARLDDVKDVDRILSSASHLVDIITHDAHKKTNTTVDVLISVKKSCKTINSVLDKLIWQLVKNFGGFIILVVVFDGVDKLAPNAQYVDYIFLVLILYFVLRMLLTISLLSYTFFINAVATNIIKALISYRTRRARKHYQQIRAAYSS